jgi:hypothetical protein
MLLKIHCKSLFETPCTTRIIMSRRMEVAGHAARVEKENSCRILAGKREGKRHLGRSSRIWEDNVEIDVR